MNTIVWFGQSLHSDKRILCLKPVSLVSHKLGVQIIVAPGRNERELNQYTNINFELISVKANIASAWTEANDFQVASLTGTGRYFSVRARRPFWKNTFMTASKKKSINKTKALDDDRQHDGKLIRLPLCADLWPPAPLSHNSKKVLGGKVHKYFGNMGGQGGRDKNPEEFKKCKKNKDFPIDCCFGDLESRENYKKHETLRNEMLFRNKL